MIVKPTDESAAHRPRQAALRFIFITVLLDVLSLALLIPVLPTLIEQEFLGGDTQRAAQITGVFGAVWALMQFLFSPVMGALSDRFGRRPVILISCFGLGLDYILMALAPNLWWLFIGRMLSGITAASFSTAAAYVADVTTPDKRAASYGLYVGSAWGIGFVVGPAIGGMLGDFGLRVPLWCAACLTLLNALYGFWVLPESLSQENRSRFSLANSNPLGSLRLLRSSRDLGLLAVVYLLYQLAHQVFQNVFVLYSTNRYQWSSKTVGMTLMAVGILAVIMQGYVVRRTSARLGDWRMVLIALVAGSVGNVIYGLAPNQWMFWAGVPIFSLVSYFAPGIHGQMTRLVGPEYQGRLQGANGSLMALAGMAGPVLFSTVYSSALSYSESTALVGAPFMLAAGLHLLAIAFLLRIGAKTSVSAPAGSA
ncbi:MAG TPA: tetracycline resistance MFS efflux pump [Planctomycetaceae bacterium]|nr:tetracycline resistance MFS efflux pump [Planctomycetaceae bacterium]